MSLRRVWQKGMIALARSQGLKQVVQSAAGGTLLASRYVSGPEAQHGVQRAQALAAQGLRASLFYLGEYVDRHELVEENVAAKLTIAAALGATELDIHISVDPTQIGHQLDPEQAEGNAFQIARKIAETSRDRPGVQALMLDMEDQSIIDATLGLHSRLVSARLPVALTLQAYLRRTAEDLETLRRTPAHVRLVKGAFAAGPDVAFTRDTEIKLNYRRLVDLMMSKAARESGFYPAIATHDTAIHEYTMEVADQNGWQAGEYEFEMLLGVREAAAIALANRGARVRLYTPFARDWWPHAMRRIGENPRNVMLLARSLVSRGAYQPG